MEDSGPIAASDSASPVDKTSETGATPADVNTEPPKESSGEPPQRVSVSDILEPVRGSAGTVTERLTALQQAGMWLAGGVGLVITMVTIVLLVVWLLTKPSAPRLADISPVGANGQLSYTITDTNVLTATGT